MKVMEKKSNKIRLIMLTIAIALILALTATVLLRLFMPKKIGFSDNEYTEEYVDVTIPGMEDELTFILLADLHIVTISDEVDPLDKKAVLNRRKDFSKNGELSSALWPKYVEYLNKIKPDYLLFGADMVDFASWSNLSLLKEGMDKLEIPYMYVRADHDTEPFHLKNVPYEKCVSYQNSICENGAVFIEEFPDFYLIGWNNSTVQLTAEGLSAIQKAAEAGKPIILLTHVPIEPLNDKSLEEVSRKTQEGRSLIWGRGNNYYTPDKNTEALLDMIYSDNSPFVEILCGHLHLTWDGFVTDRVHEHVFSPAFRGVIGVVRISGDSEAEESIHLSP